MHGRAAVLVAYARTIESSWGDAKLSGPTLLAEDVRNAGVTVPTAGSGTSPNTWRKPKSTSPFLDEHSRCAVTGGPLPFEIEATTTSCWCTWELEVDVTSGDHKETVKVTTDSSGRPLQTIYSGADLHHPSQYQIGLSTGEFIECAKVVAGAPEELAGAAGGDSCPD